jgi:hypothetical protein
MFYAIQRYPNKGSHFFDRHPETGSEFETREQIESGIKAWRSRVTPSMAESIVFEIHQD